MHVLETGRLILRHQTPDDAPFLLQLMNEPSWLEFIGDRGVHSVEDARNYITNGALAMYTRYGFGLYLTELKDTHEPIGLCGLIRRAGLDDVDIGFAFLPAYWNKGYAYESAAAVLIYARDTLHLPRIVAITSQHNDSSIRLLHKLGLEFVKHFTLPNDPEELNLFAINFPHEQKPT